MSRNNYGAPISGTLTSTTAIINFLGERTPAGIALNSTDVSAAISFSFDNTHYYTATPTGTMTGQIYYVLTFPVRSIKFTGVSGDTYNII